jgi:alpha-galactosidase
MSMLPEQAASWAYPQPTMSDEQIAFCLVTGLLGRYYVSGYLNLMSETQLELVREAITTAKELRTDIAESVPVWPLGLPGWDDEWVALALSTERSQHVTVWKRTTTPASAALHFPNLVGVDVTVRTTFPTSLPEWDMTWDPTSGTLTIFAPTASEAARTIELVAVTPTPTSEHHQRPS